MPKSKIGELIKSPAVEKITKNSPLIALTLLLSLMLSSCAEANSVTPTKLAETKPANVVVTSNSNGKIVPVSSEGKVMATTGSTEIAHIGSGLSLSVSAVVENGISLCVYEGDKIPPIPLKPNIESNNNIEVIHIPPQSNTEKDPSDSIDTVSETGELVEKFSIEGKQDSEMPLFSLVVGDLNITAVYTNTYQLNCGVTWKQISNSLPGSDTDKTLSPVTQKP